LFFLGEPRLLGALGDKPFLGVCGANLHGAGAPVELLIAEDAEEPRFAEKSDHRWSIISLNPSAICPIF
jgi:hypothetical protein